MTIQEAYEGMYDYFSRPGAVRALDESETCVYRTEEGNKCAVGCLIPDEAYLLEMDTESWPIKEIQKYFEWGNGDLNEFLCQAQRAHDNYSKSASEFLINLQTLALDYNLTLRTPQTETPDPLG